jgi:hypothetical protein
MLRLTATLVATTRMRPWRTGWSVDRGVDFAFVPTATPVTVAPEPRGDAPAGEPPCFLDADWAGAPTALSLSTSEGRAASKDAGAGAGADVRAWWTLASKPSDR